MEGASNGHRSYETGFSVRYLAGELVVVVGAHVFVVVVVAVVVARALLRGPLALAHERGLGRLDGFKCLVVGGALGRLA